MLDVMIGAGLALALSCVLFPGRWAHWVNNVMGWPHPKGNDNWRDDCGCRHKYKSDVWRGR